MIHAANHVYVKHMTMKAIEEMLPHQQFKRVHRSFIVFADTITGVYGNTLEIGKKMVLIDDKYRKDVTSLFRENSKF